MPSAFAHVAPALALIPVFHRPGTPKRLWVLGAVCAVAPDLDVIAFRFGIPYDHALGHRGLWHSIPFAAVLAAVAAFAAVPRANPALGRIRAWLYLFAATASHGILDAFTNGGLGVALLSPFDLDRYFAPFRPIEVSPLSIRAFFSGRGLAIVGNEIVWVWLPFGAFAVCAIWFARRRPAGGET